MRSRVVALVVIGSLWSSAVARADGVKITQELFGQDGWPFLVANYVSSGPRAVPSWQICAPDCGPVVATDSLYRPGPTTAGTTFAASATVDGTTTVDRSRAWGGQVTNTAMPTLSGEPKVGQVLTPSAGTWTGGWGDDVSLVGVRACRTAAAQDCRAMTASSIQPGNPSQVTIDSAYTGWYVGAVEHRAGAQSAYPAILYRFPPGQVSSLPAPAPGQTVAVGPLSGPVTAGPDVVPPAAPGTPPGVTGARGFIPIATLRKRAARRGGASVLGTISCPGRCVAHLTLRHGRKAVARRIVLNGKRTTIMVRSGTFPREATALRVTVRFEGFPTTNISRSVKLR